MKQTMPAKPWSARLSALLQKGVKALFFADPMLDAEAIDINAKRLLIGSIIAIPVCAIHIVVFALRNDLTTAAQTLWRSGIIASHSVIVALMSIVLIVTLTHRKKKLPLRVCRVLQYSLIVALMVVCSAIVSFDQLVTDSITPFLVFCSIVGAFFLIRHTLAVLLFVVAYATFFVLVGVFAPNPEVLLSNRVNGLTAIAFGFVLSVITWRNQKQSFEQRLCIERQKKALERLAYTDALTGLSNRRFMTDLMENTDAPGEDGGATCLIAIDIDDFKQVNDAYGHPGGDAVLRLFGRLLQDELRSRDTVSRMGGDEFLILLANSSVESGAMIAERLRKLIERHDFAVSSSSLRITASFGIAPLDNSDKYGFLTAYHATDKALYVAKLKGKNRVEIASAES